MADAPLQSAAAQRDSDGVSSPASPTSSSSIASSGATGDASAGDADKLSTMAAACRTLLEVSWRRRLAARRRRGVWGGAGRGGRARSLRGGDGGDHAVTFARPRRRSRSRRRPRGGGADGRTRRRLVGRSRPPSRVGAPLRAARCGAHALLTRPPSAAPSRPRLAQCLGEDPTREGLLKTPLRMAKALLACTAGYSESAKAVVGDALFECESREVRAVAPLAGRTAGWCGAPAPLGRPRAFVDATATAAPASSPRPPARPPALPLTPPAGPPARPPSLPPAAPPARPPALAQVVLVRDIDVYSLCEHHMLPFHGKAHIAYLPTGRVVGLSKLARLVDTFSKRLQIQERLTREIAQAVAETVGGAGVAVLVECT